MAEDPERRNPTATVPAKKIPPAARFVLDHWNEQKIIRHGNLTWRMLAAINDALKYYELEEIFDAISKYAAVLKSPDTFVNHKFKLARFLTSDGAGGIEVFTSLNEKECMTQFRKYDLPDIEDPDSRGFVI